MSNYRSQEFDLRQQVAVLRRGRSMLILFCLSAMLSSLVLTYVYSERYRSNTTILYRPAQNIRFQANKDVQALGFPVPLIPFEVIGQTISQLATSENVLRKVVSELKLDQEEPNTRTGLANVYHQTKEGIKKFADKAWEILQYGRTIEQNRTNGAIEQLAKNINIESTRKDYTVRIEVSDKNPERAARIVDMLAGQLVTLLREQSKTIASKQRIELDRAMGDKKAELDGVRSELEKLKNQYKFISLREQVSLNLRSMEELDREMRSTDEKLVEARAMLKETTAQRQALSPMIKAGETKADDSLFIKLRDMKAAREVERKGLLQRLPADHLDITTLSAQIKAIDETLAGVQEKRVTSESTQLDDIYRTLLAKEIETKARIEGLEASKATLKSDLERVQARYSDPAVETRLSDLTLRTDVLESSYKQLATAREEARIGELSNDTEIKVLYPATAQDAPFRPIKVYHVLLSGILAVILGVGVVYLVDFWRSLMRPASTTGAVL